MRKMIYEKNIEDMAKQIASNIIMHIHRLHPGSTSLSELIINEVKSSVKDLLKDEPVVDKACVKVGWSNPKIGIYRINWRYRDGLGDSTELLAVSEHSAIEKLRSQIADERAGEELIIINSVELIPHSNSVGQWPSKCDCGRNANPHVAVGENNDPFNVRPW